MARPATAAVRLLTGEREPCRVATSANKILFGLQVIDTVQLEVGDRVLVKSQTDARENGIYTASEGQWFRAADARTSRTLQKGTTVHIQAGAINAATVFSFQAYEPVIGTDDIILSLYLSDDTLGDAQAAATAAASSASAAAGSASAASTSATNAASSASAAGTSATNASSSASSASTGATNASNSATAAAGSSSSASTSATNAGNSATAAAGSASAAAASAAGVNLPFISAADVDKRLIVNAAGTGYDKVYVGNIGYPQRFGTYDRTGVADSVAAINSALSSYKYVELGEGTFKIGSAITYAADGRQLRGVGKKRTILRPSTANLPGISIPTGRANCELIGMTVDRNAVPMAGGDGVLVGQTNLTNIRDIECLNNWVGLNLGPIGFGQIDDYFIHDNYSHGILMSNNATLGALQWYLYAGLIQGNDGWGALVAQTALGTMDILMGDWDGVKTYGNTAGGLGFSGSASIPIKGIRLKNGFIGADGGTLGEIYLDTYGGLHCIENMFAESAGQSPTGRGLATAASNAGNGVIVTSNNVDVEVISLKALSNKGHGLSLQAFGYNKVIGGYSRNNGGWGCVFADGAKGTLVGMEFESNTIGNAVALSNASKLKAVANIPDTVNNNGQRTGTATSDNADAGNVGEYVSSLMAAGSAVALTTATPASMTSISLTAGDWDVDAVFDFTGNITTTVNYLAGSISLTNATLDATTVERRPAP